MDFSTHRTRPSHSVTPSHVYKKKNYENAATKETGGNHWLLLSLYFKEGRHRGKILVWKKFLLNSRIDLSAFILLQILYCVVKIAEVRHKGEFENLIDCLSSLVSSELPLFTK